MRSHEGTQQGDTSSSLLFSRVIHHIVQRTELECDIIVHRWYAYDAMLISQIGQLKLSLDIIAEYSASITLFLNPTKTKVFWSNQEPLRLAPLKKTRPRSTSLVGQLYKSYKIIGVPLWSPSFVFTFIIEKHRRDRQVPRSKRQNP